MESTNMRSQILDVAQDLIQRTGVNAMSYADISKAIGIRKASIHYYFPTKEDLVVDLLDRYNQQFCHLADQIITSAISSEAKLNRYCDLYVTTLSSGEQDKACLCGVLTAELQTLNPRIVQRITQFYRHNESYLEQILQAGLESGEFDFRGNPKTMARLIFSLMQGDLLVARAEGGVARIKATTQQMMALISSEFGVRSSEFGVPLED
jgi:TetR/AcrR family transcriptional regulator, transcriptional repressor for nem operon